MALGWGSDRQRLNPLLSTEKGAGCWRSPRRSGRVRISPPQALRGVPAPTDA